MLSNSSIRRHNGHNAYSSRGGLLIIMSELQSNNIKNLINKVKVLHCIVREGEREKNLN